MYPSLMFFGDGLLLHGGWNGGCGKRLSGGKKVNRFSWVMKTNVRDCITSKNRSERECLST